MALGVKSKKYKKWRDNKKQTESFRPEVGGESYEGKDAIRNESHLEQCYHFTSHNTCRHFFQREVSFEVANTQNLLK